MENVNRIYVSTQNAALINMFVNFAIFLLLQLFLNGRRVRLFDMDTEEEEDLSVMDSSMNTTQQDSDISHNITSESLG